MMNPKNKKKNSSRTLCGLGFILIGLAFISPASKAGVIAVDEAIPAVMDAGGIQGNPAEYILGEVHGFNLNLNTNPVFVGETTAWNSLVVQNSSMLVAGSGLTVGGEVGSTNNTLMVNSSTIEANWVDIGFSGSENHLVLEDGTNLIVNEDMRIGYNLDIASLGTSNDNLVTIKGEDSRLTIGTSLTVGWEGSNNSLRIVDGGKLILTNRVTVGEGNHLTSSERGSNNSILVSGLGSELTVTSSGDPLNPFSLQGYVVIGQDGIGNNLTVEAGAQVRALGTALGYSSDDNTVSISGKGSLLYADIVTLGSGFSSIKSSDNNLLTVADDALLDIGWLEIQEGSFLRVNEGYVAWWGDRISDLNALLASARIQVWNDATGTWRNANGSELVAYGYFESEAEAFAFSGYEGLSGYTLLTSLGADTPSELPDPLRNSISQEGDWYFSAWFGLFTMGSSEPGSSVIFSYDFGWAWVSPSGTPQSMWWWSYTMNAWLWGGETTDRWFYRSLDDTWIYVVSNESGGCFIFEQATGSWSYLSAL